MLVPVRPFPAILLALALCACSSTKSTDAREAPQVPAPAPSSPAQPDNRKVLVVFGNSLSAGQGLDAGQSFPDHLQEKLDAERYSWRVVNLGISGNTTEEGAARIDSALALKPAIVVLELGGNDGLRGLPLAVTRKNLATMIESFQNAGARVVLAGMSLPPNYGADYIKDFEKLYKDLAAHYRLTFIPFLLADIVTPDLRYLQRDGIHPTAAGAEIVSGTVFRAVKPLLGRE
jgi:acyl-CoA thioesterase I